VADSGPIDVIQLRNACEKADRHYKVSLSFMRFDTIVGGAFWAVIVGFPRLYTEYGYQ